MMPKKIGVDSLIFSLYIAFSTIVEEVVFDEKDF
jgi:hypothetical protein